MDNNPVQKTKVFRVKTDFDLGTAFENLCKNESTNINAKLKELIDSSLKGQKRYFLAGKNEIIYDKLHNSFSWFALLDSGKPVKILDNLSDNFLKDIRHQIDLALQERNDWVHNRHSGSVDVPGELVGGKE